MLYYLKLAIMFYYLKTLNACMVFVSEAVDTNVWT